MKIYFAGPLFTQGEREMNLRIVETLRMMGHEVFLPQEQEQKGVPARQIFLSDVRGIDWADVVVACMDGADPDSGTCWECGYAYNKKPVLLWRSDIREEGPPYGPYNLMMHQASQLVLDCKWDDCATIAVKIDKALSYHPFTKQEVSHV